METKDFLESGESDFLTEKIKQLSVPILESIRPEEIQNFKPYHERYYENKYCTSFNTEEEQNDTILRFHSNKLVLISIAEGHHIFQNKKIIEKIDFMVNNVNMLNINVSGKKKAGAKKLKKGSILCYIKCKGEEKQYPVYCCIPASLIEVNKLVFTNPQLLVTSYKELGYIAVLNTARFGPKNVESENAKMELLSEEEYKWYMYL